MMIGLIDKDIEQYGILKLNDKSHAFAKKPTKVEVALNHNYEEEANETIIEESANNRSVVDPQMLGMLKDLRQKIAKANNLPTYVIFQENSLEEMATKYPITMDEMAGIIGVSKGKAERYGKKFIEMIKQYVDDNDIDRPTDFIVRSVANKAGEKIKIIQAIDKRISLDDLARTLGISRKDMIAELETIVHSGTKLNIDYHLNNIMDEDLVKDIYDYFRSAETDSLDAAMDEFSADGIEVDEIQLVRIKFMSELAN
jgi:ATP-dependent DNA helicase RecQ